MMIVMYRVYEYRSKFSLFYEKENSYYNIIHNNYLQHEIAVGRRDRRDLHGDHFADSVGRSNQPPKKFLNFLRNFKKKCAQRNK